MSGLGRGAPRVWRGLVLGTASLLLAGTAHVAAGGSVGVDPMSVTTATLLLAACVAAADRRFSLLGVASVLGGSQVLLHVTIGGHAATAPGADATMLVAHAGAALAAAALLAGADRTLWVLSSLLGRVWRRLPAQPVAIRHEAPRPRPHHAPVGVRLAHTCSVLRRRGPPVAAA